MTISQRGAWFDLHLDLTAIDIECDFHDGCSRFGGGAGQGTLHQGCEQGAAVACGAVNVVGRIDHLRCHLGGRRYGVRIDNTAIQDGFRSGRRRGRSSTPMTPIWLFVAWPALSRSKKAATPASAKSPRRRAKLLKPPAARGRPRRESDLRDQLIGCQRGGERPEEERRSWNQPGAGRTDKRELGITGDRDAGHLGGRIGMR